MSVTNKKANKNVTKAATFTEEERAAMKERVQELKGGSVYGEKAVVAKIAEMQEPDKSMAKRIHEIVKKSAPDLAPRTWYGMPAYTNADGKVVCFFQSGHKYKSRYCTFGFQDTAILDEGNMWATGFALERLTPSEEKKIAELVKKAVS
jgi:uncharacterized protein YdhG (YjbR/CyaY superfamily)